MISDIPADDDPDWEQAEAILRTLTDTEMFALIDKSRLSELLAVHRLLRGMFPSLERCDRWLRAPNEAFGGVPALEVLMGAQPGRVRAYLEAEAYG